MPVVVSFILMVTYVCITPTVAIANPVMLKPSSLLGF